MATEETEFRGGGIAVNIKTVSTAIDVFAQQLKRHITSDAGWLAEVSGLPDLTSATVDEAGKDTAHLEATVTLFFIWWKAQQQPKGKGSDDA